MLCMLYWQIVTCFLSHTDPKRKISPLDLRFKYVCLICSQNPFLNTLSAPTPCLCDREKGKQKIVNHIKSIVSLGKTKRNRR